MSEIREYQVAFSFAGEDREYVKEVAEFLKRSGVKVFYDFFEESELWGKNLYEYLSELYEKKAEYTVVFISSHYREKLWTNLEREAAQARAFKENSEYILPARFDDTEIPGIKNTVGYVDLSTKEPIEVGQLILKKLKIKDLKRKKDYTVKIPAQRFVDAIEQRYGSNVEITLEWFRNFSGYFEEYDTQLHSIIIKGRTEEGVEYEIDIWQNYEYEEILEELSNLEGIFKLSNALSHVEENKLPLTYISAKNNCLDSPGNFPNKSSDIYLHYGLYI